MKHWRRRKRVTESSYGCEGIFKYHYANIRGCFAFGICIKNALFAELVASIKAIEITHVKSQRKLWLECDSMLVVQAFRNDKLVSWQLKNGWSNAVNLSKLIIFTIGHIYPEGNTCADRLASHGVN